MAMILVVLIHFSFGMKLAPGAYQQTSPRGGFETRSNPTIRAPRTDRTGHGVRIPRPPAPAVLGEARSRRAPVARGERRERPQAKARAPQPQAQRETLLVVHARAVPARLLERDAAVERERRRVARLGIAFADPVEIVRAGALAIAVHEPLPDPPPRGARAPASLEPAARPPSPPPPPPPAAGAPTPPPPPPAGANAGVSPPGA